MDGRTDGQTDRRTTTMPIARLLLKIVVIAARKTIVRVSNLCFPAGLSFLFFFLILSQQNVKYSQAGRRYEHFPRTFLPSHISPDQRHVYLACSATQNSNIINKKPSGH